MATLNKKVKLYLEDNSKVYKDEKVNFELQDDYVNNVSSPYIKTWNVSNLTEPTAEQIASYETAGNTEEELQTVLNNRANDYPSIKDQLDKIYHSGIDEWKKVIKTTKDKYPKWVI